MSSSLYARLKAISGQPKPKKADAPKSCAILQRVFALEQAFCMLPQQLESLCELDGVQIPSLSKLLFLDTETTVLGGGAGTVAFLVGVGWMEDGYFICRQYWMRNYDEEADLVARLEKHFESEPVLVTFNGKTFDVPLLQSRFIMQQKRMASLGHIDLLSHARRIFKLRLGRVNLTALEQALLGQQRQDDLPGAQVPQRYFDYLKTGDESLLAPVFEHNAQDVFSLSKILKLIATAYQTPESLKHAQDLYGVGRTYERAGQTAVAQRCYALAATDSPHAAVALGRIYKRQNRMGEAVEALIRASAQDIAACVALAKYYEHQLRNYDQALLYTDRAIVLESRAPKLLELFHRRARLIDKIAKKE